MATITSMVTIGDGRTPGYTISLDEIDLSLMPIFSHQRRDRTVPLWSPAASGPGAEYYEFQVLAEEGGDSDDERLENAPTVLCHVCATSVSVSHWQRHVTSAIHQANQIIAQISLSRAQQMALAPPVTPTPPTSNTYFCPPCSTTVALTKRATHKHSDQHSSNVLYSKLLQSLAKLYESKDKLNSVCEEVFKAISEHDTIYADLQLRLFLDGEILTKKDKKEEINKDDAKKNHNEEFDDDDDDDAVVPESEILQKNLKKEKWKNVDKKNHKGNYDNDDDSSSTSESEDSNTETDTNTDYTITAQSGAKLRISFDNYHGFSTSCGKTLCRVCRVMVEDKQKHVLMETHADKLTVAVKDKHCIRPLTTILSHCVLCNDLVGNSDEGHMTTDAHIAALQRALIQDDIRGKPEDAYTKQVLTENHIQTVAFNEQNYYCPVCQIYIFKSALMEHVAMDAHKKGLNLFRVKKKKDKAIVNKTGSSFCGYCKVNVGNGKKAAKRHRKDKDHKLNVWLAEKDTMIHYHFKESKYPDKIVCKICSVLIDVDKVNEHINGFNHQNIYNNMLKDHHMQETRGYNVHCFLCNTQLYMIEVLDHIKNNFHTKRVKQCSGFDFGPEELKLMHQGNQDCKNAKLIKFLQSNRINNSYSKGERYYECRVCDISFLKPSLLNHIITKKHKKNLLLPSLSKSTKETKSKSKSLFIDKEHKVYTPDNVPNYVIPESQEEKANSVDPELHLALKTNLIESHSHLYNWCNACKRLVTKELNIMHHIESTNHKRNIIAHQKAAAEGDDIKSLRKLEKHRIEKRQMKYYCNACNVNFEIGYEDSHIRHVSHSSNIAELCHFEQSGLLKKGFQYYCSVCLEWVPHGLGYTHIGNEKHKTAFVREEKLKFNDVVKTGINYFCEVCLVPVQRWLGEEHINSDEHLLLFRTKYINKVPYNNTYFIENDKETQADPVEIIDIHKYNEETGAEHVKTPDQGKNATKTEAYPVNHPGQSQNVKETEDEYFEIAGKSETDTVSLDDPVTATSQSKNATETQANLIKTTTIQTMPKLTLQRPIKKLHYLFDWTYDVELEVLCLVCETNLSFNDVMAHRKSKTHKEVYKDLLETNTMFRIRHRCFCECCREIMKVNEEYTHFTSERHGCNLARNTERLGQSALMELSIRMFNEDVAAGKRIKSLERYVRTSFTFGESEDEERKSEIDDTFWSVHSSTVTFDQVDEERDSEEDNSVSDSDASFKSAETNDQGKDETNDVRDLSEKSEDHEIVEYIILETQSQEFLELPANFQNIAHLFEQTDNTKDLLCLICKSLVPNWSDQILQHVEGIKHIKKYKRVFQMHDLKEIFDVSTRTLEKYICKSCGIEVGKSDLFLHINGVKHKLYLNAQPSTSGCPQLTNENISAPANNKENEVETDSLSNITKKPVSEDQMSTEICSDITKDNSKLQVQQSHEIKSTIAETEDTNQTATKIKQSEQTVVPTPDISEKFDSSDPPIKQSDDIRLRSVKNKKTENSDTGIKEPKATEPQTKDEDIFQHNLKSSILTQVAPAETKDTDKSQHMKQSVETQPSAKKSAESKSTVYQLYVKPSITTHIAQAEGEKSKHIINQSNEIQIEPSASAGTQNLEKRVENRLCVICNVNIPNNITSIREHLTGNEHNEKVKGSQKKTSYNDLPIKVNSQENQITAQNACGSSNTHITKVKPTLKVEDKITNFNLSYNNIDPYIKDGICSLCNMKVSNNISNIKEHVNGNNHKKMFQSLVTNKKSLTNTQVSNEVCQNTTKPSAGGSQSKRKVVKKITIPYISAAQALLPENNVNTYVKNGHCYLCNLEITNGVSNIKIHVNGNNHKGNLNNVDVIEIIRQNSPVVSKAIENNSKAKTKIVEKISDPVIEGPGAKSPEDRIDNYFIKMGHCYLCGMDIPNNISNIKDHINGKTHRKMLQSLETTNTQNEDDVIVNQPVIPGSSQNISGDMETSTEREINIPIVVGAEAKLPENTIDTYVKKGYCYVCDKKVPNNVSNIEDHVQGKNHKQNLLLLQSNNSTVKISYVCPICNIKILKNTKNVLNHLKNTMHKVNVAKLLNSTQDITTADPNSTNIGTESSSVRVSKISDIKYEASIGKTSDKVQDTISNARKSKKNMQGDEKITVVDNNQPVIPGSSQNTSGNMETSTEREINIPIIVGAEAKLPQNTIDTYVKKGYCYVCDKKVPNNVSNIEDHVEGKTHKQNLLSLLQSNKSTLKINYVCPICNIKIPKNYKILINHLTNTMHKVNVAILLNSNSTQNITTADINRTNIGTEDSLVSVSKISDIKDEASRGKTSDNVDVTNSNAHKTIRITQGDEKISIVDNTYDTNTATDSSSYVGTNDPEVSKNEYAEINTKHDVTATDLSSYVGTNDIEENTETHNSILAETTNDSNKVYHSVDNDDSYTTTDSSCYVETSDSGVNRNEYAKTENTITSKHVDDAENNYANTSDIFYNCKTEGNDNETDDSDVEALDEGFYICRVCDKLILDNETDVKSHLDSFRHKINLKEKQFKEGMFPNTTTVCDICKVDVPNNPIANKKHAESEMHKWRFEKVLLENKIKIRDDKVCYCEVCDLYFSKITVSSHVNRSDHVKHFS